MKIYLDTLLVMPHPRATPWRIISAKFMPDFSRDFNLNFTFPNLDYFIFCETIRAYLRTTSVAAEFVIDS